MVYNMSKQVGKQGESNLILEPEQFSNSFFNSQQSSSSNPKLPTISRKDRHMDLIKKRYAKNKDVAEYLRSYDFIKRAEELSIIYLFERDSSSTKLQIPLTTDEQILVKKFCDEMIKGITEHDEQESVLKYMERIIEGYLNQGIRLNSYYGRIIRL